MVVPTRSTVAERAGRRHTGHAALARRPSIPAHVSLATRWKTPDGSVGGRDWPATRLPRSAATKAAAVQDSGLWTVGEARPGAARVMRSNGPINTVSIDANLGLRYGLGVSGTTPWIH